MDVDQLSERVLQAALLADDSQEKLKESALMLEKKADEIVSRASDASGRAIKVAVSDFKAELGVFCNEMSRCSSRAEKATRGLENLFWRHMLWAFLLTVVAVIFSLVIWTHFLAPSPYDYPIRLDAKEVAEKVIQAMKEQEKPRRRK